jgi:hypothetical protein
MMLLHLGDPPAGWERVPGFEGFIREIVVVPSKDGEQGPPGPQGERGEPGRDADPEQVLAVVAQAVDKYREKELTQTKGVIAAFWGKWQNKASNKEAL